MKASYNDVVDYRYWSYEKKHRTKPRLWFVLMQCFGLTMLLQGIVFTAEVITATY